MWLFIIIGVVVFMILVVLHEFGHFIAGRKCGMKVTEFGIGLPPKICNLRKDKKGMQYTLNRVPLGGFCSFEGDDPTDDKTYKDQNNLFTAPLRKRLIVIFAGVTMNFLTAFILFTFLFRHGIQPISVSQAAEDRGSTSYLMASPKFLREKGFLTGQVKSGVLIVEVQKGGLGEQIDLRADDVLLAFDEESLDFSNFSSLMQSGEDKTHAFTIQRGGTEIISEEFECDGACKFGIIISENGDVQLNDIKFSFGGAILATFHEIGAEWNLTMEALAMIGKSLVSFKKSEMKEALNSLAGPIGAVKMGEIIYDMGGWLSYLGFAAMLSLALAIFNVLPIPVLDGGRAIGMILQKITRISPKKFFVGEAYVDTIFMYILLGLGVIIGVKDLYVFYRDSIVDYVNTIISTIF